jgi:CDP-diacylglycerol---glycerol-3-phosphate 3-phosphatidyltransferase
MTPATPRRDAIRAFLEPVTRRLVRTGLTPNQLTLIGFGVAALGALLAGLGWWLLAGIVATAGAAFDLFDGEVARATGTSSAFGAFMDSTFDRWGEALVYVGIIAGTSRGGFEVGVWLAAAAMASAFLVSYTRARAESLGFSSGKGMAAVGFAPREIRTAILGVGLVAAGVVSGTTSDNILGLALGAIALLATITVIQRILFVRRQASSEVTQ